MNSAHCHFEIHKFTLKQMILPSINMERYKVCREYHIDNNAIVRASQLPIVSQLLSSINSPTQTITTHIYTYLQKKASSGVCTVCTNQDYLQIDNSLNSLRAPQNNKRNLFLNIAVSADSSTLSIYLGLISISTWGRTVVAKKNF